MSLDLRKIDGNITDSTLVGHGSYGRVYRVKRSAQFQSAPTHSDNIKHLMAVKVTHLDLDDNIDAMGIVHEIQILKALKSVCHPNIIKLHACALKGDYLLAYMEYMPTNLVEAISTNLLSPQHVGHFTTYLLRAISFLHASDVLHCDIKPANVMVDMPRFRFADSLKLIDFGLSTLGKCPIKRDYVVTRWYRPPELLLGQTNYTSAVDVWGAACTILEMNSAAPKLKAPKPGVVYSRALFKGRDTADQLRLALMISQPTDKQLSVMTGDVQNSSSCPPETLPVIRSYLADRSPRSDCPFRECTEIKTHLRTFWDKRTSVCTPLHDGIQHIMEQSLVFDPQDRPSAQVLCDQVFKCMNDDACDNSSCLSVSSETATELDHAAVRIDSELELVQFSSREFFVVAKLYNAIRNQEFEAFPE